MFAATAHGDLSRPGDSICAGGMGAIAGVPLHEGKSYDVVGEIDDSLVADAKVMLLRDKGDGENRVAGFEEGYLKKLLKAFPKEMEKMGIAPQNDGLVTCPHPPGLNARLPNAFARNGVKTAIDRSPEGLDHLAMARLWANKETPVSENGRDAKGQSLRFHDTFVHVLGYAMMPKELVDLSAHNMKSLLQIYDHPSVKALPRLQQRVKEIITGIVSVNLEIASASMPYQILEGDAFNLSGTLYNLKYSGAGGVRAAMKTQDVPAEVERALAPILDGMKEIEGAQVDQIAVKMLQTSKTWK